MFYLSKSKAIEVISLPHNFKNYFNPRNSLVGGALALLLMLMTFLGSVNAQVLYGTLTGNITDTNDAVVSGAKVEVTSLNTGAVKTATTDERA